MFLQSISKFFHKKIKGRPEAIGMRIFIYRIKSMVYRKTPRPGVIFPHLLRNRTTAKTFAIFVAIFIFCFILQKKMESGAAAWHLPRAFLPLPRRPWFRRDFLFPRKPSPRFCQARLPSV
jgi:hypothetical protein